MVRLIFWKGFPVALKEFFCDRYSAFERELTLAKRLQKLEGTWIPRVLLVGRDTFGKQRFIGFQAGHPLSDDYAQWTPTQLRMREQALSELRKAGFKQSDPDGRNFVLLRGDDGCERVAVVDFESLVPVDDQSSS